MDKTVVLTIEQCRGLDAPVREELELLDYEVRCAAAQLLADVDHSGNNGAMFLRASTTVLLSIAASLLARAPEDKRQPLDTEAFVAGAQSALQWARLRKLRYFVGGQA